MPFPKSKISLRQDNTSIVHNRNMSTGIETGMNFRTNIIMNCNLLAKNTSYALERDPTPVLSDKIIAIIIVSC